MSVCQFCRLFLKPLALHRFGSNLEAFYHIFFDSSAFFYNYWDRQMTDRAIWPWFLWKCSWSKLYWSYTSFNNICTISLYTYLRTLLMNVPFMIIWRAVRSNMKIWFWLMFCDSFFGLICKQPSIRTDRLLIYEPTISVQKSLAREQKFIKKMDKNFFLQKTILHFKRLLNHRIHLALDFF